MPQLNPTPWLWTLFATWVIFTTLLMPKILEIQQPTSPKPTLTAYRALPWLWPWP